MASHDAGPTVEDLLDDPVALAVMRADHIDPDDFRALLGEMAVRLRSLRLRHRTAGPSGGSEPRTPEMPSSH
jgi:hypothetical protein